MQHSNKAEKMITGKRAAWGEAITKKGDKRNKRQRGGSEKRNWAQ